MRFQKSKSGLWLPKTLRNQRGFISPGLMPPAMGGALTPPATGIVLWNSTPIAGASNNDNLSVWPATAPTSIVWNNSGGAAPVYKTSGINGRPAIFNNGASCQFETTGADYTDYDAMTECSMYFVGKSTDDPDNAVLHGTMRMSSHTTGDTWMPLSSSLTFSQDGMLWLNEFTTATKMQLDIRQCLADPHIFGILSADNNYTVRVNGIEEFTTATNTWEGRNPAVNLQLFYQGTGGGNFYYDGYIGEIIVYDHVLDAGEIAVLEAYFADKWGITVPYVPPVALWMTDLYLWLDAATIGGSDSDPVSTWADQSGNGFDFTGSSSTRPLYRNASVTINGLPVVQFDGVDDELVSTALDTDGWTGMTLFVVGQRAVDPPVTTTKTGLWDFNASNNSDVFYTDGNFYNSTFVADRQNAGNPSASLASPNLITIRNSTPGSPDTMEVKINGKFQYVNRGITFQGRNVGTAVKIGKSNTADGNFFYDGVIAEVLLYQTALDASAVAQVENFLMDKYNIS